VANAKADVGEDRKAVRETKHPSGDRRFEMLDSSMKKQKFAADSLIEILHTAQELFGFLKADLLYYIARALKLPPSRVFGVATFYHLFSFTPPGRHTCTVCTGTACYVKGADAILGKLEGALGVRTGKTRADGEVSLATARCLGACGLAPIVVYDGNVAAHQTVKSALEAVEKWNHGSR
jgi:bidirectional [NiFe] hydrogenase diaphorase subunit